MRYTAITTTEIEHIIMLYEHSRVRASDTLAVNTVERELLS